MNSNPIVEKQLQEEKERRAKEDYRYPIHVVCVFMDAENNDFPIILEVRNYCNKNNLIFTARQYNCDKFADDLFIHRLPAFHLYFKKGHQNLGYFDTNPILMIQKRVWDFQDELEAKERAQRRRREKWNAFKENLYGTLSLEWLKKKPQLDIDASLSLERYKPEEV